MSVAPTLERRAVMRTLIADRGDLLVVAGLGSTTYDLAAAGDHPLNFYLWGAMGGAAMIGLGLALAQPARRVLVATGDGEMLMGLGALATIAVQQPTNLAVVVIDNERYAETGLQETHTAHGCDLPAVAKAVGFESVHTVRTEVELTTLVPMLRQAPGPLLATIKVTADRPPFVLPSNDGVYIKNRFREALLGAPR
ncbi:MAG TPA: thiamine pyrophosphate-dependent enzyme [Stellaceae bacterium]|nr:thiamine pyrophosphate-dependent enzyme [Stellaceae bacterium]